MIRALSLGFALAFGLAVAAPAQVALTPDGLRQTALAALQSGAVDDARRMAEALVARDPADTVGRAILAELALASGDPAAIGQEAADIWRTSTDPTDRYRAARLAAWAATQREQFTRAQFWLRRAITVAPDPASLQQTVSDFRAVRDANPLSFSLGLSVSPSDNVNNGTTVDVIEANGEPIRIPEEIPIFGGLPLSPAAIDRAYSGWSYSPSVNLSWRLHRDDTSQTRLWGLLQGRGVILSDAAIAALDGERFQGEQITARHFSFAQILVGAEHERNLTNGTLSYTGHLGQSWSRGDPAEQFVNIGVTRVLNPDARTALIFGGNLEWRHDIDDPGSQELRQMLRAGHIRILDNGMRLRFDLSLTHIAIGDAADIFDRATASVALTPQTFLPGIEATARLGASWAHYPDYAFTDPIPGGRTDRQVSLGLDLTFDRFSYAGFSPTLSIEGQRTDSNVNQFESAGVTVGFGIESTF